MANVARAFACCYWDNNSTATTLSANTPAKVAGTTTAMSGGNGFVHTNNNLECDVATTRMYKVTATISASKAAGSTSNILFYLYKDQVAIPGATIKRTTGNSDTGASVVQAQVSLADGEDVELWCETDTGDDVTVSYAQLLVETLG